MPKEMGHLVKALSHKKGVKSKYALANAILSDKKKKPSPYKKGY